MLRITAIGAGAVDYLIRGSGCCADREHDHQLDAGREHAVEHAHERTAGEPARGRGAARYFGSAVEHGEPAGRWGGRGAAGMFGVEVGAEASEDAVRAAFGRLEDPATGESLGRAPRKFRTTEERVAAATAAMTADTTPEQRRQVELAAAADGRKAVAYYDCTFSPSKSVSVYYAALLAAGDVEGAARVAAAHDRAVERAMAYAEDHVAYTRTGYHGRTVDGRSVGRYEAGEGLVWTKWRHSTNRESEPQLHTHVAVLNRLRTLSDGVIRALDGRGFRPVKEAMATAYERAMEEELVRDQGVVFADRPDGKAREIVGVDPQLCAEASTRRAQTLARTEELTAQYVARNGREPDAAARKAILHDAAMSTRKPKEGVAGPAAVAAWGAHGDRAGRLVATLEAVADAAEHAAAVGHPDVVSGLRLDPRVPEQRAALLAAAVADVQHEYATWTVGNLVAAIDRRIAAVPDEAAGDGRPAYLEALAREAVEPGNGYGVALLTAPDPVAVPAELRRPQDGRSIFRPHIDERYATFEQLAAEERIVAGARQLTAPSIAGPELELLRVELAAAGLGADQVNAVAGIVSSGRAGDVLIGPAGTGKSYTVAALAQAWSERVGGRVLGLATTEIATQNLVADGVPAMNTARFLAAYEPGPDGQPARERVGRGDLFVVDEAGMSSTAELSRISRIVAEGGGKLVYTGDQAQLTSVGAGGMLSLLVGDNGAHELAEVHRFAHGWEAEASLRLRAGDTSVIPEYEDRGRLHGGSAEQMQAAAMRAWLADTIDGKESLLIVGTNEAAAQLSREIRDELVRYGHVAPEPLMELGRRTGRVEVSVGDRVQARQVDRSIRVDGGQHVANRAVYTVLGVDEDGALRVRGADGGIAHLPRSYVAEHLTLAYASTVHAAQGRTVDTSHALLDEAAAREAAYVALSRGREANHAYLVAQRDPDAHQAERLDSTAAARLAGVLGNVEAQHAAEVERRIGARDGASLAWIGTQWDEVSRDSARARYVEQLGQVLDADAVAALTAEPGWPRLVRAVREAELAGHNSAALLTAAVEGRPLADAEQVSDVLRYRVRVLAGDRTPEQQVEVGQWTALAPPVDGPVGQFAHELAVLAEDRQAELGQQLLHAPPAWAVEQLGPVPSEADVALDDTMQLDAATEGEPAPAEAVEQQRHGVLDVVRAHVDAWAEQVGERVEAARTAWARRAGAVAAYRELRGISEDATSIGAAPSREQEFHRRLWSAAAAALGISDGRSPDPGAVDYRTMSDADLYQVRERWTREQAWAPAYVADEMRSAYTLAREYGEDAALAGARLAQLEPDDPAWEQTAAQLERSERLAELTLERARQLDEIHHSRGGWYETTEPARAGDELARAELERRGLPAQRELVVGEQLELFDPTDLGVDDVHADVERQAEVRDDVEVQQTAPQLDAADGADPERQAEPEQHPEREAVVEQEPAVAPQPDIQLDGPEHGVDEPELHHVDDPRAAELAVEPDDVELEQQHDEPAIEAAAAVDAAQALEPERAEPDVEQARAEEPAVVGEPEFEQLALLEVERDVAAEVAAQPLHTPEPTPEPDPAVEQARSDAAAAERERQEQARITLAEARRQAEAADAQRQAREAAATADAALERARQNVQAAQEALAEQARREEDERREQLIRWHEQDRAAELDQGRDDGPSLSRDY
jgi:conjugative relaxase-like TrwC/TraI family protein